MREFDGDGDVDARDIELITRKRAAEIYQADVWMPVLGDAVPARVYVLLFDGAVEVALRRWR